MQIIQDIYMDLHFRIHQPRGLAYLHAQWYQDHMACGMVFVAEQPVPQGAWCRNY